MNALNIALLGAGAVVLAALGLRHQLLRIPVTERRTERRPAPHRRRLLGLAVAGAGLFVAGGPLALLAAGAAVALGRRWLVRRSRLRRAAAIRRGYPDAIDLVVLAVRAGLLPAAALASTAAHLPAELRVAFDEVTARIAAGERFADALGALPEHLGDICRPMIDSFAAAERYGLPLAPVLERLADEGRAQRRRDAEAAARQLPVRLAGPLVLCTLPSFVLLAIVPLLVGAFSSWRLP